MKRAQVGRVAGSRPAGAALDGGALGGPERRERRATDEDRGERRDRGFVTDHRDRGAVVVQPIDHRPRMTARRQRCVDGDRAQVVEAGGHQLGGLHRARQRRADDGVERHALLAQQPSQAARRLAAAR
jgi:hypothetical protein